MEEIDLTVQERKVKSQQSYKYHVLTKRHRKGKYDLEE